MVPMYVVRQNKTPIFF